MSAVVRQQPSGETSFAMEQDQMKIETTKDAEQHCSSRNNFPKGLRGGGACFDCLACLCCCCAIEEMACFECCKDC